MSQITPTTPGTSTLSDHQLLRLCIKYGTQAKLWKQKFLGLLPEVERRKLYLQQGCSSIFEFAAKIAGVSREQVLLTLRLEKRFDQVPELRQALTSGTLPLSKLSRVASVATSENQEFLLCQSSLLSNRTLETLVKDLRNSQGVHVHASNPKKTEKVVQSEELQLPVQIRQRLLGLQNKGINLEELLGEFLDQREAKIQQEKQRIAEELREKEVKARKRMPASHLKEQVKAPSRYIPQKVKQLLKKEYGDKCAHQRCVNKSINIHHKLRFALDPSHNPAFLVPLCKQHHEIAHTVDVRAQEFRVRSLSPSETIVGRVGG